jgi:hypothetical protein
LLLDGNHAANARAVRDVAREARVPLTAADHDALAAFEGGRSMTPNQTAQVQDLLYRTADARRSQGMNRHTSQPGDDRRVGIDTFDTTDLVGALRGRGAYQNTGAMQFHVERTDQGFGHMTVTHRDQSGRRVTYDPWPGRDGQARLTEGGGGQPMRISGIPNPAYHRQVYVEPQGAQTYYEIRGAPSFGGGHQELRRSLPNGQIPNEADEFQPFTRLPDGQVRTNPLDRGRAPD